MTDNVETNLQARVNEMISWLSRDVNAAIDSRVHLVSLLKDLKSMSEDQVLDTLVSVMLGLGFWGRDILLLMEEAGFEKDRAKRDLGRVERVRLENAFSMKIKTLIFDAEIEAAKVQQEETVTAIQLLLEEPGVDIKDIAEEDRKQIIFKALDSMVTEQEKRVGSEADLNNPSQLLASIFPKNK